MSDEEEENEKHERTYRQNEGRSSNEALVRVTTVVAFTVLLCEKCALPDETLATAFLYTHKYGQWQKDTQWTEDPGLDDYSLFLAALSLAAKTTENLRRMRELLVPAWDILHAKEAPLTFPSHRYDALRAGVVNSEMILLRALQFDVRLPLPYVHLPRLLDRVVQGTTTDRSCISLNARRWVTWSMRHFRLSVLYPQRAIALVCVYLACQENGLEPGNIKIWCDAVPGVDWEDVDDALKEFQDLRTALYS